VVAKEFGYTQKDIRESSMNWLFFLASGLVEEAKEIERRSKKKR